MDYTSIITQIGFPSFICYILIKEVIVPLVKKKENKTEFNSEAILNQLTLMNSNHLHSIEEAINSGNKDIVRTINDGNNKMVETLGEIKGILSK